MEEKLDEIELKVKMLIEEVLKVSDEGLDLHVTMSLAAVPGAAGDRPLELGLAAIVEDRDGALAWWALRHPAARPDFHDPGSFALRLEPAASVPA